LLLPLKEGLQMNTNLDKKDLIEKLKTLPKEEIIAIVLFMYKNKEQELIDKINIVFDRKTKKPINYIAGQSKDRLINLLESTDDLPSKKINELFEEYWYGKNPSLYFFEISKIRDNQFFNLSVEKQEKRISQIFDKNINTIYKKDILSDFIFFKVVKVTTISGVLEVTIEFQNKHSLIDPDSRSLSHIYGLEEAVVWFSKEKKAAIIKSKYVQVANMLMEVLSELLGCELLRFNLTKDIVNDIFGFGTIRSAHYIEPDAGDKYVVKKTYSDPDYTKKEESKLTDQRCDRPSSYHNIDIDKHIDIGINVNERGRITINKQLKKTDIRGFAVEKTKEIIEFTSTLKSSDIKKYMKSYDIHSLPSVKNLPFNKSKEIIRELVIHLNVMEENNRTEALLNSKGREVYKNLQDYFNVFLNPVCSNCGTSSYICKNCGADNKIVVQSTEKIFCSNCDKDILNIQEDLACAVDNSHTFDGGLADNLSLIGNKKLRNLINNISHDLKLSFVLHDGNVIKIKGKILNLYTTNYKFEYLFDEILSFKGVSKLSEIPQNVRETQLKSLVGLGEKCINFQEDDDCRNCLIKQKGLCIQRLISHFVTDPKLHAHSGYEYGDLTFKEVIEGSTLTIVGLSKSCLNKPNKFKLTLKNQEGLKLIAQFLKALSDDRIQFISVVSSAIIDDDLKETLKELVKWKTKKLLFIERDHIVRLLSDYLSKLQEPISANNYHLSEAKF
jgi:hypothetical protein